MTLCRKPVAALAGAAMLTICACSDTKPAPASDYLQPVQTFADNVLEHGRDHYGAEHSPLFADGLRDAQSREPLRWTEDGNSWVISNFASQQNLMRLLVALSELSGDIKYREAAEAAARHMFEHQSDARGLLYWGGHQFVDLETQRNQFRGRPHELKNNFPYYEFLWQVDADASARMLRAIWNAHVLDWSRLDLNRHGEYGSEMGALWEHEFTEPEPFFAGDGLTFINAGTDLMHAALSLYLLNGEEGARDWGMRLAQQYVRARHPRTGLGAYQYSQPRRRKQPPAEGHLEGRLTQSGYGDRAQNQFGAVFGDLALEGKVVWGGRASSLYGRSAIMWLHLSQQLPTGPEAEQLRRWTLDGLRALIEYAYVPEHNHFRPLWSDGTDLSGHSIARGGYYGEAGTTIEPWRPDGTTLLAYTRAAALSPDDALIWKFVRSYFIGEDLGDPGAAITTVPALNLHTAQADPDVLVAVLELHRASGRGEYLQLAQRMGDNILEKRFRHGYFHAKQGQEVHFDDRAPLALLMLESARRGVQHKMPPYLSGTGRLSR